MQEHVSRVAIELRLQDARNFTGPQMIYDQDVISLSQHSLNDLVCCQIIPSPQLIPVLGRADSHSRARFPYFRGCCESRCDLEFC